MGRTKSITWEKVMYSYVLIIYWKFILKSDHKYFLKVCEPEYKNAAGGICLSRHLERG